MKPSILGQFEQLVLAAILDLEMGAYGVTIHARIEQLMLHRRCHLGAVYATLDRLEEKGLVASELSAPIAQRGGRKRRLYRLSRTGEKALADAAGVARRVVSVVEEHWGEQRWIPV